MTYWKTETVRIYRETYSKPLPAEAKVFARKDGNYARFTNGRGRQKEARLTKDGNRILVETSHWRVDFDDNSGIKRTLRAFTDRQATQRLADNVQRLLNCKAGSTPLDRDLQQYLEKLPSPIKQDLTGFGLLDQRRTAIGRTLEELLTEFEQSLRAQELCKRHIDDTVGLTRTMFEYCGFGHFSDIDAGKVETYLKGLREGKIAQKDKRGRPKKLRKLSYRRSNAYLKGAKQFCNWLIERGYVHESPLQPLKELDWRLDRRHVRRPLDVGELRRLLYATANGPERYGMSGRERYLLYRLVIETGLRADEIRKRRKADFDFDRHTVTIDAATAKGKRQDVQYLSSGLSEELREFMGGKLPDAKAFGGWFSALTDRTATMLQEDLAEAGIAYKDETGRVFDFHSLRGQCATLLAASGVSMKTTQSILRHKDVNLTANVYTHVLHGQEAQAVASLPDLSLGTLQTQVDVKTGTDDKNVGDESLSKACFSLGRQRTISDDNVKTAPDNGSETAFLMREGGSSETSEPMVGGSSPSGRSDGPGFGRPAEHWFWVVRELRL